MTLWERLQDIGILRRSYQADIAAECGRFKADQAFQQYMDNARFNIITQLDALELDDIEGYQRLKRFQMALDGFVDYIEGAIIDEKMKERHK